MYDKANINGRANKAISYYITTVDKNSSAPEYDVTHDTQGSSQDGYFGIDITMPDEEVDVYIFAVIAEKVDNVNVLDPVIIVDHFKGKEFLNLSL